MFQPIDYKTKNSPANPCRGVFMNYELITIRVHPFSTYLLHVHSGNDTCHVAGSF